VGSAKVHFANAKSGVDVWESLTLVAPVDGEASGAVWDEADVRVDDEPELESAADPAARFAPLPPELSRPKKYGDLAAALKDALYRTRKVTIWKCDAVKETSKPQESEADFRIRLSHSANERRDAEVEKLRVKYAPKLAAIQEQRRKAEQRVEKEKAQTKQQGFSAMLSMGASVIGALLGRKTLSAGNISKAATAARQAGRVMKERQDEGFAQESVDALDQRYADLNAQFIAETDAIKANMTSDALALDSIEVQPKKADINVERVALVWQPFRVTADGRASPAS
jgi:hypothetical protein